MFYPPVVFSSPADQDGCGYYRIIWPLISCTQAGVLQVRFPEQPVMLSIEDMKAFCPDAILVQRAFRKGQLDILKTYKDNLDVLLVYTIDDWIGKVPDYSPHFNQIPKNMEGDIRKAIRFSDRLIVTNDYLANVYGKDKGNNVFVIPNYLPFPVWGDAFDPNHFSNKLSRPRIGWSGGSGHSGDLEILREIADELGDRVTWVFSGMLPKGFNKSNCEFIQSEGTVKYPHTLRSMRLDLALAPLLDNDFNRAKSNLRLLEYGACGYPTLASDVLPYRESKPPVELLPYDAKKWVAAIKKMLFEGGDLPTEGKKLHDWVWANHKMEDHVGEYSRALSKDKLGFVPTKSSDYEETIDVLITAYNNLEVLKPCVDSILQSEETHPYEIVIIDDGSAKADVKQYLKDLESTPKVTVHRLPKNMGYVSAINEGIKLHPKRDVLCLNSDTEVSGNWITRLRNAAYFNKQIATSIPFTNRGTLASYPKFQFTNPIVNVKEVDEIAKFSPLNPISLPTTIGFAMLMKREALDDVGLFDTHAYGKGYGEENDWSMRARIRGWLDVLAPNVYVTHKEGQTYKSARNQLIQNSLRIVNKRFPDYMLMIDQWSKIDPLRPGRAAIELAQLESTLKKHKEQGHPIEIVIVHSLGGGVEVYLKDYLTQNDVGVVILRGNYNNPAVLTMQSNLMQMVNMRPIDVREPINPLAKLVKQWGASKIKVETTVGMDSSMPNWIERLSEQSGIPYELMVHDYYPICPKIRMIDASGTFCGGPGEKCIPCIEKGGSFAGYIDINQWHSTYRKFFQGASTIFAPSQDTAQRISDYLNVPEPVVIPHEKEIILGKVTEKWTEGNLKVILIGALYHDKGSDVLIECAKYAEDNKVPIEFIVVGTVNGLKQQFSNIKVMGQYKNVEIGNILNSIKGHLSWFPAIWPETYSFTLSHALRAGLWPIAFDLGAIAERIKEYKFGTVMPFELYSHPKEVVEMLIQTANQLKYDDMTST